MKALVFDLRGNPGGLLDQAIKVADEFVDTGTIVTTVGYANKQREEKRAHAGRRSRTCRWPCWSTAARRRRRRSSPARSRTSIAR